jgi:hypothetical protein
MTQDENTPLAENTTTSNNEENGEEITLKDVDIMDETAPTTDKDKDEAQKSDEESPPSTKCRRVWNRMAQFYWENEFVCLVVLVILLARAYPPLGKYTLNKSPV